MYNIKPIQWFKNLVLSPKKFELLGLDYLKFKTCTSKYIELYISHDNFNYSSTINVNNRYNLIICLLEAIDNISAECISSINDQVGLEDTITSLEQESDDLDNRLDILSGNYCDLETERDNIQSELDDTKSIILALQSEVKDLTEQLNEVDNEL